MTSRKLKLNQKGYTLIELAVATAVMAVLATTVVVANQFVNKQGVANADRTFATEKAVQMYEELRTLVSGNESAGVGVLTSYTNSSNYDKILTTDPNVDTGINGSTGNPADPLSGNFKSDGNWRYMRQVEVDPVANDSQAKRVTVKVYLYPGDYGNQSLPGPLLATVAGILRTSQLPNVPTQVLDIYILQINNIPSWWSVLPTLAGYMQAAVSDLRSRLQGYQIRVHYVTRTSYGRDIQYAPETNSFANPADSTHQPWVYYYPGITPQDAGAGGTESWYFDPETSGDPNSLLMTGNFRVDGTLYPISNSQFNGEEAVSYAVADQYNNAMRYPDEMAAYAAVTAAAAADALSNGVTLSEGATEISERMLLEGMLSQPASFANSMIINLHGELLPLPPLRNYSDAAKDPGNYLGLIAGQTACPITVTAAGPTTFIGDTNVRVVTHPELLYYPSAVTTNTAVTVRLRVYAYYDSEDIGGAANLPGNDPRVPGISLFFPDAAVTLVGVTAEIGNGLTSGITRTYAAVTLASPYTGNVPGDVTALNASGPMDITSAYVGANLKQTLIRLYNTPLRCPAGPVSNGSGSATVGGLDNGDMLYGQEYIPSSPDVASGSGPTSATYAANTYIFTNHDLSAPEVIGSGNTPRNTARWIISLAVPVTQIYAGGLTIFNTTSSLPVTVVGQHTIETYLGTGVTTVPSYVSGGVTTPITPDLSRTYVWCGDSTIPPYTEQYQFTGDPRDCPYLDVKAGGISMSNAAVTIAPWGYNWWFKGTGAGTAQMATDGFSGFGQAGTSIWSGNGGGNINVDLPRYYQIIRQGLLKTTSIWTGTNGWSWFYYGMGGEYGSDQEPRANGVVVMDDLFKTSGTGVAADFNDLYQGDGTDGSHGKGLWVISNVTGSNSVTWYQRSWLGELYPDKSYNTWVTYGNLPSIKTGLSSAGAPETFYCEPMETVNTPTNPSDDGFAGVTFWVNPGGYGSESFYDGNNTTTTNTFEHLSTDHNGNEMQLAVTTYNIYPFPLPAVVDVNREWDFNGGNPPESATAPYNSAAMTTTLDIPAITSHNGSGGVTSRIFYDYNGNGATSPYGSGVVRMTQVNGGTTQIGYVIETGTAPTTAIGPQTLAETALVLSMRTFLDGGQMAAIGAPGHIVQLPLVKIFLANPVPEYNSTQAVSFTVACPVTATTAGGGAPLVGMPVTDIWWNYNPNGLASYYTEEYPQYSLAGGMTMQTGNYQETTPVIYNLKYSNNGGNSWLFVQDGTAAVTGVCDCNLSNIYNSGSNPSGHAVTNLAPWTYNWPVATGYTGGVILPQGSYQLMVEAYRQGLGEHYAYDIQNITISW